MNEYDRIAEWYAATRSPDVGMPDLAAFARTLPRQARILDLGCGTGLPISRYLIREGFEVVALDSSPAMIARYRANFPDIPAQCQRAETADFPAESFAGVVAWGVLFHLPEAEQMTLIGKVADWLQPGGRFLFTSGDVEGQREGEMNGATFPYVSLGASGYRNQIERVGMRLQTNHHDEWDNIVYVAVNAP